MIISSAKEESYKPIEFKNFDKAMKNGDDTERKDGE